MGLEGTRLETDRHHRNFIAAAFGFGTLVVLLVEFIPRPMSVNLGVGGALAVFALLVSAAALWLPDKVHRKINYAYLGVFVSAAAVWATGIDRSPLEPLFLFSAVLSASVLTPKKTYVTVGLAALLSATPLLYRFNPALFRREVLLIPLMYALAYAYLRVSASARFERRARYLMEAIGRVGDLSAYGDLLSVLSGLVDALRHVTESDYVILYMLDPSGEKLRAVAVDGEVGIPLDEARAIGRIEVALGEGITGKVAASGKSEIVNDMEKDPRGVVVPNFAPTEMSSLFVPMRVGDRITGVIRLTREGLGRYAPADLRVAEIVSGQAAVAAHNARLFEQTRELYEKTRWLSIVDPLTGLFNQRYLAERLPAELDRAEKYGSTLSLLMIDADTLKQVNDGYGHDAGDRLIIGISETLKANLRIGDTPIRYAGDEFVVILPDAEEDRARLVAERVRRAILKLDIGGGAPVGVSLGVASFPAHARTMEELFKSADQALYASKRRGRNCLTVFEQAAM